MLDWIQVAEIKFVTITARKEHTKRRADNHEKYWSQVCQCSHCTMVYIRARIYGAKLEVAENSPINFLNKKKEKKNNVIKSIAQEINYNIRLSLIILIYY